MLYFNFPSLQDTFPLGLSSYVLIKDFKPKQLTPFLFPPISFLFKCKSNFHVIDLSIKGKNINHDISLYFFSLLISLLHGHTVITGSEFPDRCLSNFDGFVYVTFNQGDKVTLICEAALYLKFIIHLKWMFQSVLPNFLYKYFCICTTKESIGLILPPTLI